MSNENAHYKHIVSVIVPCRNERNFIEAFVNNALQQQVENWVLEVIVADGLSDDGTRDYLQAKASVESRLRWIDNPGRIVSTGLNLAIESAVGAIIVRMDVHTRYADDYILQCMRALKSTGAICVGGPWVAEGQSPKQRAIAAAFQSRIGSGGAASRRADFSGWVDTVYLGAWRRSDLVRLGGFDESLVRNQDDELALRIHRQGGRVWQSADILSAYCPRESMVSLYRQFSQYGYWKIPVIRKHKLPASLRHLAPFAFFSLLVIFALLTPLWAPAGAILTCLILFYVGALGIGTRRQRVALGSSGLGWLTIAAVATIHLGYAVGFARAVLDFWVLRKGIQPTMTRLTR